jgi:hypothetical protein
MTKVLFSENKSLDRSLCDVGVKEREARHAKILDQPREHHVPSVPLTIN